MDNVLVNVTSTTVTGGWVEAGGSHSDDYTTGLTNLAGVTDASFTVFDVQGLPSYAKDALLSGQVGVVLTFNTRTSSAIERTLHVYGGNELPSVANEIAHPSRSNAKAAWKQLYGPNFEELGTIAVRKGVPPFSSDENQDATQSINITKQVVAALKDGKANLLLWFSNTGAATADSLNVTNLSISVQGLLSEPSSISNRSDLVVSARPFAPFATTTVSSSVPDALLNGPIELLGEYQDKSVALTGSNYYLILQSNAANGTLSGPGLTPTPLFVGAGQAGYLISGTNAEITAKLQALTFTPLVGASGQAPRTTFTIAELNGLPGSLAGTPVPLAGGVVTYVGTADNFYADVPPGSTQVVLNGGTTNGILIGAALSFTDGVILSSSQRVEDGGTVTGTVNTGGILEIGQGGRSIGAQLRTFNANPDLPGKELVGAGGRSTGTHVFAGSAQIVSAGGRSTVPVIEDSGNAEIYGTVDGATVAGTMTVRTGGVATKTTVGSGGAQIVSSGGQATDTEVLGGGSMTALSGGIVDGLTIAGGAVILQRGAQISGRITFSGLGSLEIDGPVAPGSSIFTADIAGLSAGDTIDLTGLRYTVSSRATISGSDLIVSNGVATETFKLRDPPALTLAVGDDGQGGTLISVPLRNSTGNTAATPVAPLISGGRNSISAAGRDSLPFYGVQVLDSNDGSAETLTIRMSDGGASGTLSGTGLAGGAGGTYSLSGSADAVTAELRQLRFTAASLQPNSSVTVTFTLTDTTTVGTSATNAGYSVTVNTPAANPMLTGSAALTTVSEAPVMPFASATLTDPNADSTEALTIQLSNGGAGGVLSGAGLSGGTGGAYSLSGTADQVTAALRALVFTPAKGAPGGSATTTFSLMDTTTAGTTASISGFGVTDTTPAVPPPAPTARPDQLTVQSGTSGALSAASLLLNDTPGKAGDALAVTAVSDARHGAVALSGGQAVFTPDAGYVGKDAGYSYTVTETGADGGGTSTAQGQVGVTVLAAPAAGASSYIWSGSAPGATYDLSSTSTPQLVALQGGTGDNVVLLGAGGGSAHGGGGADVLVGGSGNDVLTAGTGVTTMTGGGGSNTFILVKGQVTDPTTNGGRYDLVTDFKGAGDGYKPGEDMLTLLGFSAATTLAHVGDLASDPSKHVYQATDGAYSAQFLVQYAGGVGSDLGQGDWRTQ